jgi:hypothetical protein
VVNVVTDGKGQFVKQLVKILSNDLCFCPLRQQSKQEKEVRKVGGWHQWTMQYIFAKGKQWMTYWY